jgi:hypothetical protein
MPMTRTKTKREEEMHILETQIALNEMLGPMRDDDFVAELKAKLRRLRQGSDLKLVAKSE